MNICLKNNIMLKKFPICTVILFILKKRMHSFIKFIITWYLWTLPMYYLILPSFSLCSDTVWGWGEQALGTCYLFLLSSDMTDIHIDPHHCFYRYRKSLFCVFVPMLYFVVYKEMSDHKTFWLNLLYHLPTER